MQKELQKMLLLGKTILAYVEPQENERNLTTSQVLLAMQNLIQAKEIYLLSLLMLQIVDLKVVTTMTIFDSGYIQQLCSHKTDQSVVMYPHWVYICSR